MKANQDKRSPLERNLASWMEHINRVEYCFEKICGPNEINFVNEICKRFIAENDMEVITSPTSKIEKLLKSIYCFQNEVLSLMGVGSDYEKVDIIVKRVKKVVGWLEDIQSVAFFGIDEVDDNQKARRFAYQML
jgi:hypothetical protein